MRKYSGEQGLIWGDNHCEHQWANYKRPSGGGHPSDSAQVGAAKADVQRIYNYQAGFCSLCGAWKGAYGLEPTPEMYIEHTIEILREIRRVLRKDGVVFWNVGDSYAANRSYQVTDSKWRDVGNTKGSRVPKGLKPKDLCLIPFRVAIAAQEDGWWVRSVIIWSKPNPMPESVTDRPTESHEYILMLAKSGTIQYWTHPRKRGSRTKPKPDYIWTHKRTRLTVDYPPVSDRILREFWTRSNLWRGHDYYWDADAVREQYTEPMNRWGGETLKRDTSKTAAYKEMQNIGYSSAFRVGRPMRPNPSGRNIRSVWEFPTQPFPTWKVNGKEIDHFAVFPEKLPEICIKASTPEVGCCSKCGAPWGRIIEKGLTAHDGTTHGKSDPNDKSNKGAYGRLAQLRQAARERGGEYVNTQKTIGWHPTCKCNADKVPSIVLDPFAGAGTTLWVAKKLNRWAVGYEISREYVELAIDRCRQQVLIRPNVYRRS